MGQPIGKFLLSAYALRVRAISDDQAGAVERVVTGRKARDWRGLQRIAAGVAARGFAEGVEFGKFSLERGRGRDASGAIRMDGAAKRAALEPFAVNVELAYDIYSLKMRARAELGKRGDSSQAEIIFNELVAAAKRAMGRVALDAAAAGYALAVRA